MIVHKQALPAQPGVFAIKDCDKVLSVGVQPGQLVVWFRAMPQVECEVELVETGKATRHGGEFIGTVQLAEGRYVLHAFWVER